MTNVTERENEMRRLLTVFLSLLLVLSVMLPCLPALAEEGEATEEIGKETTDFVLVLDCSATMSSNDPTGVCMAACKQFVDQLPVQDVRISVITFGFAGEKYPYPEKYPITQASNYVQVLVPMSDATTPEQMAQYKQTIDAGTKRQGQFTPIGQALVAAVDVLEKSGSAKGNACIILMSDGIITDPVAAGNSSGLYTDMALETSKANNWPIFTIELPKKAGTKAESVTNANKYMKHVSADSGAGEDGHVVTGDISEVSAAFNKIFNRFWNGNGEVLKVTGNAEFEIEIPQLASETNLVINGKTIKGVELTCMADGTKQTITRTEDKERIISVFEEGHYTSLKLICPTAGKWKIKVLDDENATMVVFHNALQERALKMTATPSAEGTLTKMDKITVQSVFTYRGYEDTNNPFYAENPASLVVENIDKGVTKEFQMEGSTNGYYLEFPVNETPSGNFRMYVKLEHNMFRSGVKKSNAAAFASENKQLELINTGTTELQQYVGRDFDRIDLSTIYNNPDGDPIEYTLNCTSDRTVKFDAQFNLEDGYLTIPAGMVPGTFDMVLGAKDPDMTEEMTHNIKLNVVDRAMAISKIEEMELWSDYYSFQKEPITSATLDLSQYVSDPDEMPLSFSVSGVSVDGLINATVNGSVLTINAIEAAEGETTLTVTANDGVSNAEVIMDIEVVSGKGVFWAKNWIWFALAVAAIALIIIIIVVISKLTRVKGVWNIKITEGYDELTVEGLDICSFLQIGKKKKFALQQLIMDILPFATGSGAVSQHVSDYFNESVVQGASKIMLKGVLSGKGCKVLNVPQKQGTSGGVTVIHGGGMVSKKSFRYSGGAMEFRFKIMDTMYGNDKELVVQLQLASMF